MNAWRKAAAYSLALSTLVTAAAQAQGKEKQKPQDKCKIDLGSPDEVKSAVSTLTLLQIGGKPEDTQKKLKGVVSSLTKSEDGKNPTGRSFALGQALVLWSMQPGQPPVAKRGDVGFQSNKEGNVDLLAAADSAFRGVETALPDCKEQTGIYRQQAWSKLINQVGPLINNNQLDSADAVLKRAFIIYRDSPYAYYFQGNIAQRREDFRTAAEAFSKAVQLTTPDMTAKDTSLSSVREFSQFSAAYNQLKASEKLTGDQKRAGMAKAAELYRAYLKDYPQGPNAAPAQAGLTSALSQSGDSTSLASMWSEMIANPSKYTEAQLFDAGTTAFRAGQLQTAAKLMELGYQANPWLRGGLFNLANTYWKLEQWDKMLPISQRLLSIDPNNPDNYQLVAIAYQGLAKNSKAPKTKKSMNDSLVKYLGRAEKLPVRVTVDEFTHDGTTYKLAGSVENLGTAAKNVVLKVDFLDKQGNVVSTQNATVSAGPKEKKNFALQASGAQIAAFRYAPIT